MLKLPVGNEPTKLLLGDRIVVNGVIVSLIQPPVSHISPGYLCIERAGVGNLLFDFGSGDTEKLPVYGTKEHIRNICRFIAGFADFPMKLEEGERSEEEEYFGDWEYICTLAALTK